MCRKATLSDIPQLLEWGEKFHQLSPWKHREYDKDLVADLLERLIQNPNRGVIFMNETGAIGGAFAALWFNGDPVVHELFWFSDGVNGKELLNALEEWAHTHGAYGVVVSRLNTGNERADKLVDRIYRRADYSQTEANYIKLFEDS